MIASKSQEQRETAKKQRAISLFFRFSSRRKPRISAKNEIALADNFLKKQRKQRKTAGTPRGEPFDPWFSSETVGAGETAGDEAAGGAAGAAPPGEVGFAADAVFALPP